MSWLEIEENVNMDKNEAMRIVMSVLEEVIGEHLTLAPDTELIGADSLLDSMKLVQACVALEDAAAEAGFEFDWTSEDAMSRSRSMFRTVSSLSTEFARQSGDK